MKLIKRFLIFFLLLLLFVVAFYAAFITKILFFNDISVERIIPENNVDLGAENYKSRHPIYLISYADGTEIFYKNQNALVLSALNKGVDFFRNYRKSLLDKNFVAENNYILLQRGGAGYWLWKPWIILHTLQTVPENAMVIYSDTSFTFTSSIKPLIELAEKHGSVFVKYDDPNNKNTGRLGRVTQRVTLENMDCNTEECRDGQLVMAGFQVYKNTPENRAFVKKWLEYCKVKENIMNTSSDKPEAIGFENHQHDQAVLSVLLFKEPKGKFFMEHKDFYKLASSHHRHPNKGEDYYSLLYHMKKKMRNLDEKLINSKFMIMIRKYLLEKHPLP